MKLIVVYVVFVLIGESIDAYAVGRNRGTMEPNGELAGIPGLLFRGVLACLGLGSQDDGTKSRHDRIAGQNILGTADAVSGFPPYACVPNMEVYHDD